MAKEIIFNLLLTLSESRTGEYWPQAECSEVRAKTGCLIVIHEAADNLATFVAVLFGVLEESSLQEGVSLH